ncbi:hypothetical protein F0562_031563 [Nyssa sinensis]|uniref:Uncharacterized protein n=1 Tax=Nyssa sinensis TaxID=561372 RepID=A0A5J5AVZ9_9ASTE|nr:hypothetical protein F0562_031563 [Nyssa sinensis]
MDCCPLTTAAATISFLHHLIRHQSPTLKIVLRPRQFAMASQDSQPFRWHYNEFDDRNFQVRGRTLFFIMVLFSIILLLTLLFLYARWVCRVRLSPGSRAATSAPHLPLTPPPPPQGLDLATINCLPITLYRSSSTTTLDGAECCICLAIFQEGDKIIILGVESVYKKIIPDPQIRNLQHYKLVKGFFLDEHDIPPSMKPRKFAESPEYQSGSRSDCLTLFK